MLKTAAVRPISDAPDTVRRWTLDAPTHGRGVEVVEDMVYVQGWLLLHKPGAQPPQLLVRARGDVEARHYPFNSGRPDVIERVLGEQPAGHAQLRCGFSLRVPAPDDGIELGFEFLDGGCFWAAAISLQPRSPVIEGRGGWLFLDNDTNRSVDQHTGVLRLAASAQQQWRTYLTDCRTLAARLGCRHAIVIAPSKEEVLRDCYPYPRAPVTVLDQVRTLSLPEDHVIDAAQVLAAYTSHEAFFKKADTHWTDRGAMIATLAVVAELGFSQQAARARFAEDHYRTMPYAGDLGVKLAPVRSPPTEFLDGPPGEGGAAFDNRLPNFGRLLVFSHADPCFDASLLMFGASSGYAMLKYLKRLFRRTVFVHSAANVDIDVANHERPDALVLQSNGRFLVQPPVVGYSLRDVTRTKLAEASEAVRAHVDQLLARGPASEVDAPYFDLLLP